MAKMGHRAAVGGRGMILPLMAVCLTVLMGFAGIAVDVSFLEYRQQQQQTATDAAAFGGAETLARSNCANATNAENAAVADSATNGFPNSGNDSVSAVSPPASGPYASNSCAISVTVTSNHVSTFFARLFGYPTGMIETTNATAIALANGGGACIYLLNPSSWSSFNSATVNSPSCAIAINYSADFNGGTIAAPFIGYAGTSPNYGGTTFTDASPMPMLPVADPCPEIYGCAQIAASPPPETNCQNVNTSGNTTLQPGCYQTLNLDPPGTVTMTHGTYVITGNFNDNGVTLNGSGVTIYVPSGGNGPNFDGQTVNLTPPVSPSPYPGVLYYQAPSNSSSINFNGASVNMTGLIYAPGTTSANFDVAPGNYMVLVFGSMNFNNNSAYDIASPAPGQALVRQAVLAQ